MLEDLLTQFPWLIYVLLALACVLLPVIIALAFVGFIQGREVSTPLFKVGPKHQPQPPPSISEEQMQEVAARVRATLQDYRKRQSKSPKPRSPHIPGVPQRTARIVALKLAIDRNVRDIVLAWGGGWAGSSIAEFETFHELAQQHGIIPDAVLQDISDFNWLSKPGIYGDPVYPSLLKDLDDLAAKILRELSALPKGMYGE